MRHVLFNVASNELSHPNADAQPNGASVCIPGNVAANERWRNVRTKFDSNLRADAAHHRCYGKGKAQRHDVSTHARVYSSNSRSLITHTRIFCSHSHSQVSLSDVAKADFDETTNRVRDAFLLNIKAHLESVALTYGGNGIVNVAITNVAAYGGNGIAVQFTVSADGADTKLLGEALKA